ncbi:MAG: efflux RND transporter periplasmic adaptor subunit [Thermodesulfobacteriota bacterium]
MARRIVPIILFLALAGGGWWAWRHFWAAPAASPGELRLSGHVETTETDLAFKLAGKIKAVYFEEGQAVRAGQLVAELEDEDLVQEVVLRQAALAAAQASLDKLTAGYRPQELKEAQAALAAAEADLIDKARDHKRQEDLASRGASPPATLDKARLAHKVAAENAVRARQQLSLVSEGFRTEDIAAARAQVDQAQAALDLARIRLGYARLTSPVDGVVLVREGEPGEVLAVGAPVVTLGDLAGVWLEAYLPETFLAAVRLDMPAWVTTDTWPGKRYPGRVSYVSAKAEFTPKTVETPKERVTLVYRVKVRAENPDAELKPGMPGVAVIPLENPPAGHGR